MAKIALVVVFSLGLVLSIQSVLGDGNQIKDFAESVLSSAGDEAESVKGSLFETFSPEVNKVTSEVKGVAQTLSSSGKEAANMVKEKAKSWVDEAISPDVAPSPSSFAKRPGKTSSSWSGWFKDKLRSIGLISSKESAGGAPTPAQAMAPGPGQAYARSFRPAAAPI